MTLYFDLSKTSSALAPLSLNSSVKLVGLLIPLIVRSPFTENLSPSIFLEDKMFKIAAVYSLRVSIFAPFGVKIKRRGCLPQILPTPPHFSNAHSPNGTFCTVIVKSDP